MYDLSLKNMLSESAVFTTAGINETQKRKIRDYVLEKRNNTCHGCGIMQDAYLHLHIDVPTETFAYTSFISKLKGYAIGTVMLDDLQKYCTILCEACHRTQHVEQAIKLNVARIVICPFSQLDLIKMCRNNILYKNDLLNSQIYILEDIYTNREFTTMAKVRELFDYSGDKRVFIKRKTFTDGYDIEDTISDNIIVDRKYASIEEHGGWKLLYNKDFNWNTCSGQDRLDTYNNLKKLKGGKAYRTHED